MQKAGNMTPTPDRGLNHLSGASGTFEVETGIVTSGKATRVVEIYNEDSL